MVASLVVSAEPDSGASSEASTMVGATKMLAPGCWSIKAEAAGRIEGLALGNDLSAALHEMRQVVETRGVG